MRLVKFLHLNEALVFHICAFISIILIYYSFAREWYILLLAPLVLIGVVLLVFKPLSIIYIFIVLNFYGILLYDGPLIGFTVVDIFFPIMGCSFFCSGYFFKRSEQEIKPSSFNGKNDVIFITLLLFLLAIIVSFSVNITTLPHELLNDVLWYCMRFIQMLVGYYIFSAITYNEKFIERIVTLLLVLSLVQLPIAIVQYFIIKSSAYSVNRIFVSGTLSSHHSMLGTFLIIPLSFSCVRFFTEQSLLRKCIYSGVSIAFFTIIILSGSRSALMGIIFAGFIFIFSHIKFRKENVYFFLGLIVGIICLYMLTPLKQLISNTFFSNETRVLDLSSASRFLIWKGAIDHFLSTGILNKIFGISLGAYTSIEYGIVLWGGSRTAVGAHNNFLHVLCELGIIGLIIWLAYFYVILTTLYKKRHNGYAYGYFYGTIALLASCITQETFWFQKSFGNLWLFYTFFLIIVLQKQSQPVLPTSVSTSRAEILPDS